MPTIEEVPVKENGDVLEECHSEHDRNKTTGNTKAVYENTLGWRDMEMGELHERQTSTAVPDKQNKNLTDFGTEHTQAEFYQGSGCAKKVGDCITSFSDWCIKYARPIRWILYTVFVLCYCAYFIYSCWYDFEAARALFIFTSLALLYWIYALIRDRYGDIIWKKCMLPCCGILSKYWYILKWPVYLILIAGLIAFIIWEARDYPPQLMSALGACVFVAFGYIFSKYPGSVRWRPVLWGLAFQFLLALVILRTYVGYTLFAWIGDFVQVFLSFSDYGAEFVFGENFRDHYFAFAVLPVTIYFACFISICFYTGIMQWVIIKIAWCFEKTMGTTPTESLNAAGNIFVGQTESPLLIRPFLKYMTLSELHAVMVGGFATIAGSVLGAYIAFGISASHLISASVISAPAALAMAKLFYPETRFDKAMDQSDVTKQLQSPEERNFLEAAANGACQAVPLVANIAANLIAFIALLELFNAFLGWAGGMVGVPQLSFELICSYLFAPVALLVGIEPADCQIVAGLIGTKLFINEFVAYEKLSELIYNRENGLEPQISVRSEVITTYILCGFDNVSSIGIQLGGLTPMAPSRKSDLASIAVRALVAGTLTCFMTACVAGMLYTDWDIGDQASTVELVNGTAAISYHAIF
ncbi:solute carrier family 28 member 3-like [Ptychodera flava]|uniref:solute carrier family 28 member 3-like n=1 Tax=Ptychodera flava TaxID=63121 RepID=UPI00396A4649